MDNAPKTDAEFNAALAEFMALLQRAFDAHADAGGKYHPRTSVSVDGGRKYIKIMRRSGGNYGVYCFIERATGNILKPASIKAPVLNHSRGNIYGTQPLAGCGPYGVAYMDGGSVLFAPENPKERLPIVPAGVKPEVMPAIVTPAQLDAVEAFLNTTPPAAKLTPQQKDQLSDEDKLNHWLGLDK